MSTPREINVTVVVLDGSREPVAGVIDPSSPLSQIRSDVVDALELGSRDWLMAVSPRDDAGSLEAYTPRDGDRLIMIPKELTRTKAFKLGGTH